MSYALTADTFGGEAIALPTKEQLLALLELLPKLRLIKPNVYREIQPHIRGLIQRWSGASQQIFIPVIDSQATFQYELPFKVIEEAWRVVLEGKPKLLEDAHNNRKGVLGEFKTYCSSIVSRASSWVDAHIPKVKMPAQFFKVPHLAAVLGFGASATSLLTSRPGPSRRVRRNPTLTVRSVAGGHSPA